MECGARHLSPSAEWCLMAPYVEEDYEVIDHKELGEDR
jgi:hypothetical protein